jgi:DNA invertase Pin-like site-specific DNA recombinase
VKPAIAYKRVSTASQGRSGLGLEAQQAALARFAEAEGYALAETFTEVETGKGADALDRRPQLSAALAAARKLKAPIIVAKLDRLSRDCPFHFRTDDASNAVHRRRAGRRRRFVHAPSLCGLGRERAAIDLTAHQGRAGSEELKASS